MRNHVFTKRFKRSYKKKDSRKKDDIDDCVRKLLDDASHPGLHTHKIKGKPGVFEAYVNSSHRLTFEYDEYGRIVLRNNCDHKVLTESP